MLFFFSCELTDVGVRDYKRGNPEDKDGQNKLILAYVTPDKEMKSPLFFFPRIKCLSYLWLISSFSPWCPIYHINHRAQKLEHDFEMEESILNCAKIYENACELWKRASLDTTRCHVIPTKAPEAALDDWSSKQNDLSDLRMPTYSCSCPVFSPCQPAHTTLSPLTSPCSQKHHLPQQSHRKQIHRKTEPMPQCNTFTHNCWVPLPTLNSSVYMLSYLLQSNFSICKLGCRWRDKTFWYFCKL